VRQDPKHSILDSQSRAKIFLLGHTQMFAKGNDLEAEMITGTKEWIEKMQGTVGKMKS